MFSNIEDGDFCIKKSKIPGAGNGVFANKDILPGKILPYTSLILKSTDIKDEHDDTYNMTITYMNNEGVQKTLRGFVCDGNPNLSCFKPKKDHVLEIMASHVNEASTSAPNCVFLTRNDVTKEYVKDCFKNGKKAVIAYLVVPEFIPKGTELFTVYGSAYNCRGYKVWRDRKGHMNSLINKAHDILYT